MKPIQIGLLVAAGALGGALMMKWQSSSRHPSGSEVAAAAPAVPAPAPAAAPAEPAVPQPPAAAPVEPAAPATTQKPSAARRKPAATRPEPVVTAQLQTPPPAETRPATPPPAAVPQPPAPPVRSAPPAIEEPVREPAHPAPLPPPPAEPNRVTLSAGTMIPIRLVDGLTSERSLAGDTFNATLDAPLVVDGFAIAERGARVEGKVVESAKAGKASGVATLGIVLTQITTTDGQRVKIQTQTFTKSGPTSHREDATKVGAGAGIGAIIGAIAGGGKGAAIGAGVGGAAGAGDVLLTRGKPADLPSETRINFRLSAPVTITERR